MELLLHNNLAVELVEGFLEAEIIILIHKEEASLQEAWGEVDNLFLGVQLILLLVDSEIIKTKVKTTF